MRKAPNVQVFLYVQALMIAAASWTSAAQDVYPSSTVKLRLGFPPSATTDVDARVLGQKLSTEMRAPVVVENKPGANGDIAADFVARSKPDGYTLMLNTSSVVFGPALGQKLGYDLLKDFVPVTLVAASPFVLVAHPSLPANTIPEFIAHARSNPNSLAYGSGGVGNPTPLAPVLFL